jgi:hypothetical protein
MRVPRFLQLRRRPRGNQAFGISPRPMLPPAPNGYDAVRAQFESECG